MPGRKGNAAGSFSVSVYALKQVKVKERSVPYGYFLQEQRVCSPAAAAAVIEHVFDLSNAAAEMMGIIALTSAGGIAGLHIISVGSLNQSIVHPREVFKAAILNNAARIILFHNHPSGDLKPSQDDIMVTQRLCEAGKLLGIGVVDHLILGGGKFASLAELKETSSIF